MGRGVTKSRLGSVDKRRGDDDMKRWSSRRERAIELVGGDSQWAGRVEIMAREKGPGQNNSAW